MPEYKSDPPEKRRGKKLQCSQNLKYNLGEESIESLNSYSFSTSNKKRGENNNDVL